MIVRPFTFLTGLMFAFSGAYLFVVKHQSQSLEDRLGQLAQTSRADEQAIRVLKAQWALEADPSRIAALAAAFTQLKPMQPSQLVTLASLAASLPAPGSPAPYSNPEDLMPAMPGEASGVPSPSGPAIEVRGHDVTASASAAGGNSVNARPAVRLAAQTQVPEMDLPIPPPAAPAPPPSMPVVTHPVQSVRLTADRHESRSWIAPIPRQEPVVRKPLPVQPVVPVASGYVFQTRAEGAAPALSRPLGAQVVRVKAVAHQPSFVAHHDDLSSETPLDGGSLLGMAQSGSQN